MTSRLHRLELRNFKAFREFKLDLEGRHLLVYGPNGSGKSSLYWALYTFLQSANKLTPEVAKYFDPGAPQNLLNIHEQVEAAPKPGEISLILRDTTTNGDTSYCISQVDHGTRNQPIILKGNLASDFITYRFFFNFSRSRHSETFDVWPLFEREILPFCVSTSGKDPLKCWEAIKSGAANPGAARGRHGRRAYEKFKGDVGEFATILSGAVDSISDEAQRFYDTHFAGDDPVPISLKLRVTTPPSFTGTSQWDSHFKQPVIEFAIQVGGKTVNRPQAFLNEAKLTQLALSIRFAASLVNLHESDLKLLVLDDLLVSLDMSNRMKVVEILLSATFAKYQKIILTHEFGFFREFRRRLGPSHPDWCFLRLEGNAAKKITARSEKSEIQKAEDYLHGHDLDEAALCLRKAAEHMGRRWREWADKKAIPPGTFLSLTENLNAAKKRLLGEFPLKVLGTIESTDAAYRSLLFAPSDDDIEGHPGLDVPTKGILKSRRRRLCQLFTTESAYRHRQIQLIDNILACTERVLNPAAHAGDPPLYDVEIRDALDLVRRLEMALPPVDGS